MKILILGGTGAMGVSLVEILANTSNEMYVTSRSKRVSKNNNVHYLTGNAQDKCFINNILKEKFDVIVDFMIYSKEVFEERVNLFLSSTDQYMYLSSSRVYAECDGKITENSPRLLDVCTDKEYLITDEYALLKAREENILFSSNKKNWTIIRPYITYNTERIQLGIFEKEHWLQRALNGKSILFPKDIASKITTLTYGYDVAYAMFKLIGNPKAYGEAFHITTDENKTWDDILRLYLDIIEEKTGKRPKVKYLENSKPLLKIWGKYQIYFDRLYNRKFDNSKINKACGKNISYTSLEDGIRNSLVTFIDEERKFLSYPIKTEAYFDKITKENTPLKEFKSNKDRLKYFVYRYTFYFNCPKVLKNGLSAKSYWK